VCLPRLPGDWKGRTASIPTIFRPAPFEARNAKSTGGQCTSISSGKVKNHDLHPVCSLNATYRGRNGGRPVLLDPHPRCGRTIQRALGHRRPKRHGAGSDDHKAGPALDKLRNRREGYYPTRTEVCWDPFGACFWMETGERNSGSPGEDHPDSSWRKTQTAVSTVSVCVTENLD